MRCPQWWEALVKWDSNKNGDFFMVIKWDLVDFVIIFNGDLMGFTIFNSILFFFGIEWEFHGFYWGGYHPVSKPGLLEYPRSSSMIFPAINVDVGDFSLPRYQRVYQNSDLMDFNHPQRWLNQEIWWYGDVWATQKIFGWLWVCLNYTMAQLHRFQMAIS